MALQKSHNKEILVTAEYGRIKPLPGFVFVFRENLRSKGRIKRVIPLLCSVFEKIPTEELKVYLEKVTGEPLRELKKTSMLFLKRHLEGIKNIPLETVSMDAISDFRRAVYKTLYYETKAGDKISYSTLSQWAGYGNASRAVGTAMRKNPLPIIIPCHRVVSKNGDNKFSITCLGCKPSLCRGRNAAPCAERIKKMLMEIT